MPSLPEHDPARNQTQKPTLGTVAILARERLRDVRDVDVIGVAWVLLDHLDYRHDSPRFLTCHPGREGIAERLGIGVKRVTAAIKKLCGGDPATVLFAKSRRFNTSSVYTFVVAPEAFIAGRDAHRDSKGQIGPVNTVSSERVKTDPLTQRVPPRVKGSNRTESKGQIGPSNNIKRTSTRSEKTDVHARARVGSSLPEGNQEPRDGDRGEAATPRALASRADGSQVPPTNPERADEGESTTPPAEVDPVAELVRLYGNWQQAHCPATAEPLGNVGPTFRAKIAAADLNPQDFRDVLERASRSDLLTGRAPGRGPGSMEGRGASLLWFLNADNRAKVQAGEYDRRPVSRLADHRREPRTFHRAAAIDTPPDVWQATLARLDERALVQRHDLFTWLKPCNLVNDHGDTIHVAAPEECFIGWIEKFYRAAIDAALADVRPGARLVFRVAGQLPAPVAVTA